MTLQASLKQADAWNKPDISPDAEQWKQAVEKEVQVLQNIDTFAVIDNLC